MKHTPSIGDTVSVNDSISDAQGVKGFVDCFMHGRFGLQHKGPFHLYKAEWLETTRLVLIEKTHTDLHPIRLYFQLPK